MKTVQVSAYEGLFQVVAVFSALCVSDNTVAIGQMMRMCLTVLFAHCTAGLVAFGLQFSCSSYHLQ